MVKKNQAAKTCISCGLSKQLSAFLQISGPEGTSYGSICSTCRGSGLGKIVVIPNKESDERQASGSSGLKIDSKTKVHKVIAKKQQIEKKQKLDIHETKKRDVNLDQLQERKEKKEDFEIKHRQQYIEPKNKEGFLNYQSKKPPTTLIITTEEKEAAFKKVGADALGMLDTLHKEEASKQEEKDKTVDLTNSHIDFAQTGLLKFQSAEFKKVEAWLGPSAAIATHKRHFLTKNSTTHNNATSATQTKEAPAADPLIDLIDETMEPDSPTSTRRR